PNLEMPFGGEAKTVILAHLIPSIFSVRCYNFGRAALDLDRLHSFWELLKGGDDVLWQASGLLLQQARSRLPEIPVRRPFPRVPRQHRYCYKCKKLCHLSE